MRRKSPTAYDALARQCGLLWLGPEVATITTPTKWQCSQGHRWRATYHYVWRSRRCPRCPVEPRTPSADYHRIAKRRGFEWLGPPVTNQSLKTTWQCSAGHRWMADYACVRRGTGCPVCANRVRKTAAEYRALARRRGFRWWGKVAPNTRTKTTWRCRRGHEWRISYAQIRKGRGCPYCAGNRRKMPSDYRALARKRGFRWIGPEVPNNITKTIWQCSLEHRWKASYAMIQQGKGCPVCAGKTLKNYVSG